MDVNALQISKGVSSAAASPVVPNPSSELIEALKNEAIQQLKADIAEFSKGSQVKASESPLIVNSGQNVRNGSHVFHDKSTNQFVVQIVNENNEVIRQLPAEEALRIASRFKLVTGLIFDQST